MRYTHFIFLALLLALVGGHAVYADTPSAQPITQPPQSGAFQFQPIVSLPVVGQNGQPNGSLNAKTSLSDYLNSVFKLAITVSVVLAVIMITIDGFKYMTSEAVGNKKDALAGIRGALLGLILLLASYMILFIINPCILNFDIFPGTGSGACASSATTQTEPPMPELPPVPEPTPPVFNIEGTTTWCFKTTKGDPVCASSYNECMAQLQSATFVPLVTPGTVCDTQ